MRRRGEAKHRPWPAAALALVAGSLLVVGAAGLAARDAGLPAEPLLSLADLPPPGTRLQTALLVVAVVGAVLIGAIVLHDLRNRGHRPSTPPTRGQWLSRLLLIGLVFLALSLDPVRRAVRSIGAGEPQRPPAPPTGVPGVAWSWWFAAGLALLMVTLAVLVVLALHRSTPPSAGVAAGQEAQEAQERVLVANLHAAVAEGRTAVASGDPRRDSIIGCYDAMERALARSGARRSVAETPTDLLDRAVAAGLIRSDAALVLTDLFRLARFSDRPLPPDATESAAQALDQLDAELSDVIGESRR